VALKEKEKRTGELRTRLLELKASQERVTDKLERVKGEQAKLKSILEERTVAVINTRAEANKLRPYTEQSPAVLEQSLRDLSSSLNRDRAEIERLDKRNRALQTSGDSFSLLQADITSLTRILSDLSVELQKEEEEGQKAGKNRDALAEQTNSVREVERKEKMLRKQLEQWQGRTEKLRTDTEKKSTNARLKMEDLRAVHRDLAAERRDRGDEVEKRRVRIEQMEKKVRLCFFLSRLGKEFMLTFSLIRWSISKSKSSTKCTALAKST
jgi:kinetochore protein Nuf2